VEGRRRPECPEAAGVPGGGRSARDTVVEKPGTQPRRHFEHRRLDNFRTVSGRPSFLNDRQLTMGVASEGGPHPGRVDRYRGCGGAIVGPTGEDDGNGPSRRRSNRRRPDESTGRRRATTEASGEPPPDTDGPPTPAGFRTAYRGPLVAVENADRRLDRRPGPSAPRPKVRKFLSPNGCYPEASHGRRAAQNFPTVGIGGLSSGPKWAVSSHFPAEPKTRESSAAARFLAFTTGSSL